MFEMIIQNYWSLIVKSGDAVCGGISFRLLQLGSMLILDVVALAISQQVKGKGYGKLLVKTAMDKTANVADLFVAECLKKAATRVSHGPSHTLTPPDWPCSPHRNGHRLVG